ncbi:96ca82bc-67f3-4b3a-ab36-ffe7d8f40fbe [Naviculisporaceae sp. PSN 640]
MVSYDQSSPSALDPDLPHTDLGPLLNGVFWTLTILALVFLLLRLHVKLSRASVTLWRDDHLLILSWIALLISAATTSACVALDYGKHLYDMDPANLPLMPFIAVFAGFFSVLAAAWSKTSFALTLLRLAASSESCNGKRNYMKYLIWFIIVTVNLILGVAMLTMWVKCWPIAKIWDGSITEGRCINPGDIIIYYQFTAGWSGTMDIVLALCPWVMLWKLTMTRREKIGVAVAMSMGVVAGIASFVKMGMLPNLDGDPVDTVAVTIWGGAEGAISIMAASIPVLRTLFQRRKDFTPLELPASPGRGFPGSPMRERDPMATYGSDPQEHVHRVIPAARVARIKSAQENHGQRYC